MRTLFWVLLLCSPFTAHAQSSLDENINWLLKNSDDRARASKMAGPLKKSLSTAQPRHLSKLIQVARMNQDDREVGIFCPVIANLYSLDSRSKEADAFFRSLVPSYAKKGACKTGCACVFEVLTDYKKLADPSFVAIAKPLFEQKTIDTGYFSNVHMREIYAQLKIHDGALTGWGLILEEASQTRRQSDFDEPKKKLVGENVILMIDEAIKNQEPRERLSYSKFLKEFWSYADRTTLTDRLLQLLIAIEQTDRRDDDWCTVSDVLLQMDAKNSRVHNYHEAFLTRFRGMTKTGCFGRCQCLMQQLASHKITPTPQVKTEMETYALTATRADEKMAPIIESLKNEGLLADRQIGALGTSLDDWNRDAHLMELVGKRESLSIDQKKRIFIYLSNLIESVKLTPIESDSYLGGSEMQAQQALKVITLFGQPNSSLFARFIAEENPYPQFRNAALESMLREPLRYAEFKEVLVPFLNPILGSGVLSAEFLRKVRPDFNEMVMSLSGKAPSYASSYLYDLGKNPAVPAKDTLKKYFTYQPQLDGRREPTKGEWQEDLPSGDCYFYKKTILPGVPAKKPFTGRTRISYKYTAYEITPDWTLKEWESKSISSAIPEISFLQNAKVGEVFEFYMNPQFGISLYSSRDKENYETTLKHLNRGRVGSVAVNSASKATGVGPTPLIPKHVPKLFKIEITKICELKRLTLLDSSAGDFFGRIEISIPLGCAD